MIEPLGEYNQPQEFFHPGIEQPPVDIVPGGSTPPAYDSPETTLPIVASEGRRGGFSAGEDPAAPKAALWTEQTARRCPRQ